MKLLHRTTRDFLLATVVILMITGVGLYLYLQKEVADEMDEQLAFQAELITQHLASGDTRIYPFAEIRPTNEPVTAGPRFGDTTLYDIVQKVEEGYHFLDEVREVNGKNYHIRVMTTYIGWDKYYKSIFYILLISIIILAISGVLITYYSNKKLWWPFFLNLQQLKEYSVSDPQPLQLHDSGIREFEELKHTLKDLTDRSRREYMALREFTENASHEIQTPLGIVQSKLDRLSQLAVTEEMARHIVQARSGVDRLSKMNKNLLLLAKLDNNAFADRSPVQLDQLLLQHLALMADLFSPKQIQLSTAVSPVLLSADPYLCDILLSNLISNAIRHTDENGKVRIELNGERLVISNSAPPLDFPEEQLFNRFSKSPQNSQSTGLGLAIVQQICVAHHWKIAHEFRFPDHFFIIHFQS